MELQYAVSRQVDLALRLEKMHEEALEFLNEGDIEGYRSKLMFIIELSNLLNEW